MGTTLLYGTAIFLLLFSYIQDKNKTIKALKQSLKAFENIMPQFLTIIFVVGVTLSVLKPEVISKVIGEKSGILGTFIAAVVGSIAMMPTFVAFSTANMLLISGAGYMQIGALVSTLTLIGVITFPLEAKYIGKKAAFFRNLIAFFFSFIVACIIGWVVERL